MSYFYGMSFFSLCFSEKITGQMAYCFSPNSDYSSPVRIRMAVMFLHSGHLTLGKKKSNEATFRLVGACSSDPTQTLNIWSFYCCLDVQYEFYR